MEYFSTFNNVFFFLLTAEAIWYAVGVLIGHVNRKESLETRAAAGRSYGIISLGVWALAFVGAALTSFAALTTFFTIMAALAVIYFFYLWHSQGGDLKAIAEKHIDTMAQDMVDHAHG